MAKKKSESDLEEAFLISWKRYFPQLAIEQQVMFHPTYKFRFDFALVGRKLAIEIQGYGTGHTSYMGMKRDYFKHNEAMRLGWKILYFMSKDLSTLTIGNTMMYIAGHLNESQPHEQLRRHGNTTGQSLFEHKINKARGRLTQNTDPRKIPRKNS